MESTTRAQWRATWERHIGEFRREGLEWGRARELARRQTQIELGPEPQDPEKSSGSADSLKIRLARFALKPFLSFVRMKLEESKPMKTIILMLDGWKTWIVALVLLAGQISLHFGGPDISQAACAALATIGWSCGTASFDAVAVAGAIFTIWALVDKLRKAFQQKRAGAKVTELLSTQGYVKLAAAQALRK